MCSLPSASGHHNPVTFCNLLRFLSTITDSFTPLGYIALNSTTTNGFCMPATAFNALPCTTACISLFAFAILLSVYVLRTRVSMLAANINCRNSVYNNVSSNVGVFDFFKSPGNIVFYTGQRTAINFLGPSAPTFGVVCASSATWLFPFACEVFVLSN